MKKFNKEVKVIVDIIDDIKKFGYLKKYPKNSETRILVSKLLTNINYNRTACAVHKTLSRDISRLSAEEMIPRAQLCSWHDIWKVVASQDTAAMMAALHNPRISVGQYKAIREYLPDGLLVIARQWR